MLLYRSTTATVSGRPWTAAVATGLLLAVGALFEDWTTLAHRLTVSASVSSELRTRGVIDHSTTYYIRIDCN